MYIVKSPYTNFSFTFKTQGFKLCYKICFTIHLF